MIKSMLSPQPETGNTLEVDCAVAKPARATKKAAEACIVDV